MSPSAAEALEYENAAAEPSEASSTARRVLAACILCLALAAVALPELSPARFVALDPASADPFMFQRSHTTRSYFHLAWAFVGFYRVPLVVRIAVLACAAALCLWRGPRAGAGARPVAPELLRKLIESAMAATAAGLIAWFGRVSYPLNATFGDGPALPSEMARGIVFPAEVLTSRIFVTAVDAFRDSLTPPESVALTSCVAGAVFAGIAWLLARTWMDGVTRSALLFFALSAAGYSVQFAGYVETTQFEVVAMLAFVASASAMLRSPRHSTGWFAVAMACLSLALLFHAAGLLLLPAGAALVVIDRWDGTFRGVWRAAKALPIVRLVIAFVIVAVPFIVMIAWPFLLRGEFGNMAGGGDGVMFVPMRVDYANRASPWVLYSMFSGWHAADISSAALLACPIALPMLAAAAILVRRGGVIVPLSDRRLFAVAALAASATGIVPLAWNHDFGMWGDWNLATCYLAPTNFLAWLSLVAVTSRSTAPGWFGVTSAAVAVQAWMASSLLAQLY